MLWVTLIDRSSFKESDIMNTFYLRSILMNNTFMERRPVILSISNRNINLGTLLPTGSEEREVLGVASIPVAILPSCQDRKSIALSCRDMNIVW